jgi:hypothetical protein
MGDRATPQAGGDGHVHVPELRLSYWWGLRLIQWIHATLGAVAVVPWNPKRQKNRTCLPPTWTADELGKRASIERFFGRIFSLFSLFRVQRPRSVSGRRSPSTSRSLTRPPSSWVLPRTRPGDQISFAPPPGCSPTPGKDSYQRAICGTRRQVRDMQVRPVCVHVRLTSKNAWCERWPTVSPCEEPLAVRATSRAQHLQRSVRNVAFATRKESQLRVTKATNPTTNSGRR